MRRRHLLLPLVLGGAPARASLPAEAGPRRLDLRHAATGARFTGPYHDGRAADPIALAELSAVLADHHAGAARPFDPAAVDHVWAVAARAGLGGPLSILSGYRTHATNLMVHGAGDSQHLRAAAVDLLLPGDRVGVVVAAALGLGLGGVGVYAARGFLHLDSGPVRRWGGAGGAPGGVPASPPPVEDRIGRMARAWAAVQPR